MARAWNTIRYGESELTISNLTGSRTVTATHDQGTTYPNAHIASGNVTVNLSEATGGLTPPAGEWGIALVEDGGDADDDYRVAGAVIAYNALGTGAALPASTTLTVPAGLHGQYRIVLTAGDTAGHAEHDQGVTTNGTSAEFHGNSDGSNIGGGLAPDASNFIVGACGTRINLSAITPTAGNWIYGQTNQIATTFDGTIINPKEFKVALSTDAAGNTRPDGIYRITPNTSGAATATGIRVDTDFSQAQGGLGHYVQVAINDTLGDVNTPANEAASDYSIGAVSGVTTAQRSPYVLASTTGTLESTNRVRTTAASVAISSGVYLTSVSTYQDSGYTTTQDIFKRRGPTNTANAIPYIQSFVEDGFGVPLATTAVTAKVLRTVNNSQENSQALTTDANGRIRWNYTLSNTAPAFNRYVKSAAARQSNGHLSVGPDVAAGWSYTYTLANPEDAVTYPGPFYGYPRDVVIDGRAFGSKEPSATSVDVFGVNSEGTTESIWSGSQSAADIDVLGVPQGAGKTGQQLGAGSLKTKFTSKLDPASLRVDDLSRHALRDGAGREIDVTTDNWFLRSATYNDTIDAIHAAATTPNDSQTKLENAIAYNPNNNSFDTIAPPTDPASFNYYLAAADTTGQRTTFDMTVSGNDEVVGFTGDTGNYTYKLLIVGFEALDSSIAAIMTSEVIQSDPTLTRRFTFKSIRVASDASVNPDTGFNGVDVDGAPVYAVFVQPAGGGAIETLEAGTMTAIGGEPSSDWFFDVTLPIGYNMVKVFATARVNGSPILGGEKLPVQIGYEFDAIGSFTGFHYK